jgi:hypothetical protein
MFAIFSPCASRGGGIRTLDFGMMRQVFYLCASTAGIVEAKFKMSGHPANWNKRQRLNCIIFLGVTTLSKMTSSITTLNVMTFSIIINIVGHSA